MREWMKAVFVLFYFGGFLGALGPVHDGTRKELSEWTRWPIAIVISAMWPLPFTVSVVANQFTPDHTVPTKK